MQPGRLAMPPMMQMAKTRPMKTWWVEGSIGCTTTSAPPATLASATEMPKAMRLIRTGSTAISRKASGSCATAAMARPVKLRCRNRYSAPIAAIASSAGISMRSGTSISPSRQVMKA